MSVTPHRSLRVATTNFPKVSSTSPSRCCRCCSAGQAAGSAPAERATEKLNKFVQGYASELKFSVDEDSGYPGWSRSLTLVQEVIRQIPSEEVVAITQVSKKLQGLLLRQKKPGAGFSAGE